MTKHTPSKDVRCKKCGSALTQQRYCWNEQCEYYSKPQQVNPRKTQPVTRLNT